MKMTIVTLVLSMMVTVTNVHAGWGIVKIGGCALNPMLCAQVVGGKKAADAAYDAATAAAKKKQAEAEKQAELEKQKRIAAEKALEAEREKWKAKMADIQVNAGVTLSQDRQDEIDLILIDGDDCVASTQDINKIKACYYKTRAELSRVIAEAYEELGEI